MRSILRSHLPRRDMCICMAFRRSDFSSTSLITEVLPRSRSSFLRLRILRLPSVSYKFNKAIVLGIASETLCVHKVRVQSCMFQHVLERQTPLSSISTTRREPQSLVLPSVGTRVVSCERSHRWNDIGMLHEAMQSCLYTRNVRISHSLLSYQCLSVT